MTHTSSQDLERGREREGGREDDNTLDFIGSYGECVHVRCWMWLTFTLTSPCFGAPTSIVSMVSGCFASQATAALHDITYNTYACSVKSLHTRSELYIILCESILASS